MKIVKDGFQLKTNIANYVTVVQVKMGEPISTVIYVINVLSLLGNIAQNVTDVQFLITNVGKFYLSRYSVHFNHLLE